MTLSNSANCFQPYTLRSPKTAVSANKYTVYYFIDLAGTALSVISYTCRSQADGNQERGTECDETPRSMYPGNMYQYQPKASPPASASSNYPGIELDAQNLLLTDRDTAEVNNYHITLLNDKHGLFSSECNKWSVGGMEPHTVIHCSSHDDEYEDGCPLDYYSVAFHMYLHPPGDGSREQNGVTQKTDIFNIRTVKTLFPLRRLGLYGVKPDGKITINVVWVGILTGQMWSEGTEVNHENFNRETLSLGRGLKQVQSNIATPVFRQEVRANRTTPLPWSSYHMVLRINDTSLRPGHGTSHLSTPDAVITETIKPTKQLPEAPLYYNAKPSFGRNDVDLYLNITSNESQIASLSQKASWTRDTAMQYPRHVSIFRGASPYARLAQPDAMHDLVLSRPAPSYSIETPTEAFNVTKFGGIVYVSNANALLEAPSTLNLTITVTFPDNMSDKVLMKVDITSEGETGACNDTTFWQNKTDDDWILCSEKDKSKTCEDLCGIGTGRGIAVTEGERPQEGSRGCVWRTGVTNLHHDHLNKDYATCTADNNTCPDFLCDPLEELHYHICPQDCTDMVTGAALSNNGANDNRGIASAGTKSVCTCDPHNKCACAPLVSGGKNKRRRLNPPTTLPAYSNTTTDTLFAPPTRDPYVSTEKDALPKYRKKNTTRESILRQFSDASTQTHDTVAFERNRKDKPQAPISNYVITACHLP
ncbi:Proto-oncogene tyrosine-protein kinase receptor ret [Zootermopsis nevadensis]|uniref:Proto-oncogene tyrosine-protein kinase receptor ret n=1 Tax=Zootermopsis nevadensis TaxID=136037 RepID=A0A067R514_ZOONE|nr:Proto-oncogene tyrosine-protein kinase receptor ret [Zootermopsis nevadensis]